MVPCDAARCRPEFDLQAADVTREVSASDNCSGPGHVPVIVINAAVSDVYEFACIMLYILVYYSKASMHPLRFVITKFFVR